MKINDEEINYQSGSNSNATLLQIAISVASETDADGVKNKNMNDKCVNMVERLLKHHAIDVNITDSRQNTALMNACESNNIEIVNMLVQQKNINLNAANADQLTALMFAADGGYSEILKILLDIDTGSNNNNTDILLKDKRGMTGFMIAVMKSQVECMDILLEYSNLNEENDIKIDLNGDIDNDGNTVLMIASKAGHLDVVRYFYQKHKELVFGNVEKIQQTLNKNGQTIAMIAARYGNVEIIKFLVDSFGINVINCKHTDIRGNTILMLAASGNHSQVIKLLLDIYGKDSFDIEQRNAAGFNAFTLACGRSPTDFELRVAFGNVKKRIPNFSTGNYTNIFGERKRFSNHISDIEGDKSVKLLVDVYGKDLDVFNVNRSDITIGNVRNNTPVMLATIANNVFVLKAFLDMFEDVMDLHLQDENGDTALMLGIKQQSVHAVSFLLENTVKHRLKIDGKNMMEIRNKKGRNAFDIAAKLSPNRSKKQPKASIHVLSVLFQQESVNYQE